MGSAMELYAGFALLIIVVVALIVLLALIAKLWETVRRMLGRSTRGRDGESASRAGHPSDWH